MLDRGYPASWRVAVLPSRALHLCLRVDATGCAVVKRLRRSGQLSAGVIWPAPAAAEAEADGGPRQPITVRRVRVVTPHGRVPILMTS